MVLAGVAVVDLHGQNSSNTCGLVAANRYTVGSACSNVAFNVPTAYTPTFNPGTCGASNVDDGWGWFTATSSFTTIQYQGNQDAVLHVFTGACGALEQLACSDAFGGTAAESVTIPTVVGQNYFIRVQRYNSSAGMTGNLCIFSSNPSSACGTTVHDSGGPSGNYSNNERRIITYCPPGPGQVVSINFSAFNTEAGWDILSVIDGPGTSGTLLGSFSGTSLPPSLTSSHPSGCLTLVFYSDGSTTRTGWTATVNCIAAPDCYYVLSLFDSFGDGWGASSVGISVNGGPFQNYTVNGSSGQVVIPVYAGNSVVLNYNATGTDQEENSYTLTIQGQPSGLFTSGSPPQAGITYTGTVDCIAPPAPQEDCAGGFTICSDQAFNNTTNNTGFTADLNTSNRGCLLANEQQGTWYFFSPATSGTVGFTIAPTANIDYDFALWGPLPDVTCPPPGPPARCSYAIGTTATDFWGFPIGGTFYSTGSYNTGMRTGAGHNSEDFTGDGWVNPMPVVAGQVYMLYIDNFDVTGQSFNLTWDLMDGATLDCTILPVQLVDFDAQANRGAVDVNWTTQTEEEVEYFEVQRGAHPDLLRTIAVVPAQGAGTQRTDYLYVDQDPLPGLSYYRLRFGGRGSEAGTSSIRSVMNGTKAPLIAPNPAGDAVQLHLGSPLPSGSLLHITDAGGRLVRTATWTSEGTQQALDLQGLDAGAYVLSIHLSDGSPVGQSRFVRE